MKHVTLSSRAAEELNAIPWHDAANGVTLLTDTGHSLGVLVHPEDYQILRAVLDITNDPRELFEMLDEEPHTKNEDDWMTLDEAFDDSRR